MWGDRRFFHICEGLGFVDHPNLKWGQWPERVTNDEERALGGFEKKVTNDDRGINIAIFEMTYSLNGP